MDQKFMDQNTYNYNRPVTRNVFKNVLGENYSFDEIIFCCKCATHHKTQKMTLSAG